MPTSRPNHLSDLALTFVGSGPADVLDVGAGFGAKGVLFRELSDVWNGRVHPETWLTRIDAIEGHEAYISELYDFTYDHIYRTTLQEWTPDTTYDFVYFGDVLEHLTKDEGVAAILKLANATDKVLYIATPLVMRPQGAVYGNPLEIHRTQWGITQFKEVSMPKPGSWEFKSFGNVLTAVWRPE